MDIFKNLFNSSKNKYEEKPQENPTPSNNDELGIFKIEDLPEKNENDKIFFKKYLHPDGQWVEEGQPICKLQIGLGAGYFFTGATYNAPKEGVLEHILNKDEPLSDGMRIYRLHKKGEYQNENSVDKTEYKVYFKNSNGYNFGKWIVDDGSFVNVGDPIFEYRPQFDESYIQNTPKSGYLHQIEPTKVHHLSSNELMFIIRDSDEIRIKERYKNLPIVTRDDFGGNINIKWDKVSSRFEKTDGITTKSDDSTIDLVFSFNYLNGNDYIVFNFNPKQIRPKQNDKVSFLFEGDKIVEFLLKDKPISFKNRRNDKVLEYKSLITESELQLFALNKFKKWRISLVNDDKDILGGDTSDEGFYKSSNNIKIVIQKFTVDYINLVNETITDYNPLKVKKKNDNHTINSESCYVYLMHDTTNGYHKIGISNKPKYRERTLQSEKPTIELLIAKKFPIREIAESIEKALHNTYSEKRLRGEWFELTSTDVINIKKTLE